MALGGLFMHGCLCRAALAAFSIHQKFGLILWNNVTGNSVNFLKFVIAGDFLFFSEVVCGHWMHTGRPRMNIGRPHSASFNKILLGGIRDMTRYSVVLKDLF